MSAVPSYVIIADPSSMRFEFYERDLRNFWKAREVTPLVHAIDWREFAERDGKIAQLLPAGPAVLRLESPARDFEVIRSILNAGQRRRQEAETRFLTARHGWIAPPSLLYSGLELCMDGLTQTLDDHQQIQSAICPRDVAVLFDKNETTRRLAAAGLPCPATFKPSGNAEDLLDQLRQLNWKQAYVKLSHGSCASGIAVVDMDQSPSAVTTVTRLDGQFYNTFDVHRASDDELREILNFIIRESATVQQSIPKARVAGQNFDIRAVVIDAEVVATVVRVSPHPMTNLHLGGWRGDIEQCRRIIPTRNWLDAMDHCVEAAALFDVPAVGIDVAFHRDSCQPYILELNAFGDFFPNWVNAKGQSIHSMEIEYSARRFGLIE